jgi:DNA repair protein RAD7
MLYKKAQPLPGQFENCEICEKRFTVTAYSKPGPDGGLLCSKCSKELGKEEKKQQPKGRGPQKGKRRQTESDRMMGDVKPGAKSLVEICVRRVAANIVDIEEFGDLPQSLLDRLSQILSQKRALDPRTLELFLQADSTRIAIYDAAKLETDDFEKIFSYMPELEDINLRNAGQMKDEVLHYMLEHNQKIRRLQLEAANLITNPAWIDFFERQGPKLKSFKTSNLDAAMDDDAIASLAANCPNITRLKLKKLWQTTEDSITHLATNLPHVTHLSLSIAPETTPETLYNLIITHGPRLQTLSLESFTSADDSVLAAIHTTCTNLKKLRFTNNTICTDSGFANLFTHWSNPPIPVLDLSDNRDVDNQNPDGPDDTPIGLASQGFKALMSHSGPGLEKLNIKACRHISHATLLHVFDPAKHTYPALRELDISFVAPVDDLVVTGIFKTCPALRKLAVFGCNRLRGGEVRVPGGVAVIGLMDARESVVVEGEWNDYLFGTSTLE